VSVSHLIYGIQSHIVAVNRRRTEASIFISSRRVENWSRELAGRQEERNGGEINGGENMHEAK